MGKKIILMIVLLIIAQFFVWIQVNGQFKWDYIKDNLLLSAVVLSLPISLLYIKAQSIGYSIFDESLWSLRLIGFSVGIIGFSVFTFLFTNELPNIKNIFCLILALIIIIIQLLWKN